MALSLSSVSMKALGTSSKLLQCAAIQNCLTGVTSNFLSSSKTPDLQNHYSTDESSGIKSSNTTNEANGYTYKSPGCSLVDPLDAEEKESVHFYDAAPNLSNPGLQNIQASGQNQVNISPSPQQPMSASNSPQHPYRMANDYANQPYVYSVPRGSMKDPIYISLGDPLYAKTEGSAKGSLSASDTPNEALLKSSDSLHPYKMRDDYAQQAYVYSVPNGSMKEPTYISTSEPKY